MFCRATGTGSISTAHKRLGSVFARWPLDDVRLHDLRHAHASIAVAGGESLYVVGKMLGHSQAVTTQRYAHLAIDPVLAAADRTAQRIVAAMNNEDPPRPTSIKFANSRARS